MAHVEAIEEPNSERELSDAVIMGLRLVRGVSLDAMGKRFGVNLNQRFRPAILETEALGLLESVDGQIRLTERGRLLGNEVFQRFLP
jgi:oxygen-independent coproporphyrinogen III oxidase